MSLRILGRSDTPEQNEKFVHCGATYKAVMASKADSCRGCAFAPSYDQCHAAPKCGYFGKNLESSYVFKPVVRVSLPAPLEEVSRDGQTQIGVPFILARDGEKYVAEARDTCHGCHFYKMSCAGTPMCWSKGTDDGISRIFVKVQV